MSTVLVPFLSFNGRVCFKINCSLIMNVNCMCQANAIISKLQTTTNQQRVDEPTILIAADTVVVYEGVIREKPTSKEEARQFLKDYSGRHAATVGSVLVTNLKTGLRKGDSDRVEIYFNEIPDEIIEKLVDEGITLNVAGGLIIEHPLVLPFVKEVVGTTDSVMGLPKALTEKLLKEAL
ncbi:Maf-like protein isoform C [Glycine soja]|uniref:Maf-like protein isoform C n=1 Tax=Glycine soja TaxID=3848 RepID=A0A445GBT2_GLYSO|nr:Maf-like protein isoform C [Glycine soja]